MDFAAIRDAIPLLLMGLRVTVIASLAGAVLAVAIGVLLGAAHLLRVPPLTALIRAYVYFFRGTPLLVLLFLSYFGLPQVGIELPALAAGILAIGMNSGAYITEAVRSALESIDPSQEEAASIDGARKWQALYYIIFPQALRQMLAPTTNELISLIKGSSLLAVISVGDVTRAAQLVVGQKFVPFEMYFTLAVIYLVLNSVVTRASILLEGFADRLLYSNTASSAGSQAQVGLKPAGAGSGRSASV